MPAENNPPHSLDAERATLGALLLDCTAISRVEQLSADDFYLPFHRRVMKAIRAAAATGERFDAVTIADDLNRGSRSEDQVGLDSVVGLVRDATTANVETYAAKVREYGLLRALQSHAESVRRATCEGDNPADILARAQAHLLKIQQRARAGSGLTGADVLAGELIDDMDSRRNVPGGVRTGLTDFDLITNGIEGGDLIVFAGRPGFGKTTQLVTIAAHVAREIPVAVFSAEMPSLQLMRRAVALIGSIPQGKLRTAAELTDAEWQRVSSAATELARRRLWIDDTSAPTLTHIRAETLALKARIGLGLVVIDYLQLCKGEGKNRYEELRDVSYGLKALAKELDVPVIALAQLNRGVESRDNKRPNASDLRDSGGIEESADVIGLLYSEWRYDPEFAMPDVIECNIVKHRNGALGQCLWSMHGAHSRVSVLDDGDRRQYRRLLALHRKSNHADL